ncbi:guanylate kinase [Plebeiibacterium marinum]|uniref:Guanylate kinase n=1 Tax=Plebeiibacterium marinum TaxID=2992111 RepID=A0AAE3SJS5_9BACT|nr:guanylate kinase [Plebeiobacterium marinum]MCW3804685.1 guanylate kinase [Plebeiobacterium marinum]
MTNKGKLIIFSAPSGSGKTTIVKSLLDKDFNLEFSISATTRSPRGEEKHGNDYYFLSPDEFRQKISLGELLEWEEVYTDKYYGTLKSEVERITSKGNNIIFDVDVVGGLNIKKMYGDRAVSIFIQPPSIEELEKRLTGRGTDTKETIKQRLNKAEEEISYAKDFDQIVVNDNLEKAIKETENILNSFLNA